MEFVTVKTLIYSKKYIFIHLSMINNKNSNYFFPIFSSDTLDTCIECPYNGKVFKGNCYYFQNSLFPISWEVARQDCLNNDGDLINIDVNYWFEFWDEFFEKFNNKDYYVGLI